MNREMVAVFSYPTIPLTTWKIKKKKIHTVFHLMTHCKYPNQKQHRNDTERIIERFAAIIPAN